jgi:hypothetical protein
MRQSSENFELRIDSSKQSGESWQEVIGPITCGTAQPASFVSFQPLDIVALTERNTLGYPPLNRSARGGKTRQISIKVKFISRIDSTGLSVEFAGV